MIFLCTLLSEQMHDTLMVGSKMSDRLNCNNVQLSDCRDSVEVKVPAVKESQENFSPSGWHVYRNKVVETGTRSSLYNTQVCQQLMISVGCFCSHSGFDIPIKLNVLNFSCRCFEVLRFLSNVL